MAIRIKAITSAFDKRKGDGPLRRNANEETSRPVVFVLDSEADDLVVRGAWKTDPIGATASAGAAWKLSIADHLLGVTGDDDLQSDKTFGLIDTSLTRYGRINDEPVHGDSKIRRKLLSDTFPTPAPHSKYPLLDHFKSALGDRASDDPRESDQETTDAGWVLIEPHELTTGLQLVFARESRLESLAALYSVGADELLSLLENAVVGTEDPASNVTAAERSSLDAAGISLDGPTDDPTGATQVLLGANRMLRFREEALSVKDAAALLNLTPARIRQLLNSGDAVSFPSDDGTHLLPAWQFAGGRLVPRLRNLVEIIDAAHPLTVAAFMTRSNPDLEVGLDGDAASPVDWLVGGGDPTVVAALALRLLVAA